MDARLTRRVVAAAPPRHNESPFWVYVPAGVSYQAREAFRVACRLTMRKFADAEKKHGWRDAWQTATEKQLRAALAEHVAKGDPRDVAIYALILVARGFRTAGELR